MASGTITGSVYKSSGVATTGYKVQMVWSSTTNISGNYSLVTVSLQICKNDGYDSSYTYSGSITINGTSTSYSKYVKVPKSGAWTEIGKVTNQVVNHNNDGSKSCSISATGTSTSSSFNSLGGWSASSVKLDTIPRASSIDSVSNTNFGSYPTLKWTPKNTSFKYRIKYVFGSSDTGWTSVISPGSTSQQSYSSLAIPQSWMNSIPSATSGTVTAYLKTEDSSGNQVGDIATKTFTGSVPSSVVPTISSFSATRVDNGVPSDWGVYVQGKSKCALSMSGSGIYNSLIKESYILQDSSRVKTNTSSGSSITTSVTVGPFLTSGTITFSGGVTDSRSRKASTTSGQNKSITIVRYAAPQITSVLSQRCLQDGTLDDEGTYIKCTCVYSYWNVNGNNTSECKVRYKTSSESWSSSIVLSSSVITPGSDSNTIVTATSIIGDDNILTDNTYNLEYTVIDTLSGSSSSTDIISTAFALMDFRSTGSGMAIGKVSEKDEFECNLDAEFYKRIIPTTIQCEQVTDIDAIAQYRSGEKVVHHGWFSSPSGAAPFTDGFVDTYVWRTTDTGSQYIQQVAYEDNYNRIMQRSYDNSNGWSSWKYVGAEGFSPLPALTTLNSSHTWLERMTNVFDQLPEGAACCFKVTCDSQFSCIGHRYVGSRYGSMLWLNYSGLIFIFRRIDNVDSYVRWTIDTGWVYE